MSSRLSNAELDFLESNSADAASIITCVRAAAPYVDDPDTLEMLLRILRDANDIRKRTIAWMRVRKDRGNA